MTKKILIVDDSNTIRQQVRAALTPHGYQILEAENGEAGLKIIKENADTALIITDYSMPVMNGLEMMENIYASIISPKPPSIILTADRSDNVIESSKNLGAKGIVIKPFNPEKLAEIVNNIMK